MQLILFSSERAARTFGGIFLGAGPGMVTHKHIRGDMQTLWAPFDFVQIRAKSRSDGMALPQDLHPVVSPARSYHFSALRDSLEECDELTVCAELNSSTAALMAALLAEWGYAGPLHHMSAADLSPSGIKLAWNNRQPLRGLYSLAPAMLPVLRGVALAEANVSRYLRNIQASNKTYSPPLSVLQAKLSRVACHGRIGASLIVNTNDGRLITLQGDAPLSSREDLLSLEKSTLNILFRPHVSPPLLPYNADELVVDMLRLHGITPDETLSAATRLFSEEGLITNPNTTGTAIPSPLYSIRLLEQIQTDYPAHDNVDIIPSSPLAEGVPGIVPTFAYAPSRAKQLGHVFENIYRMVTLRYLLIGLGSVSPPLLSAHAEAGGIRWRGDSIPPTNTPPPAVANATVERVVLNNLPSGFVVARDWQDIIRSGICHLPGMPAARGLMLLLRTHQVSYDAATGGMVVNEIPPSLPSPLQDPAVLCEWLSYLSSSSSSRIRAAMVNWLGFLNSALSHPD